ncbi:hypothetical protein [Dysgonomonas sp. 520]|uniref:hypothetical protein n=1 Tax=Dysgonomonas sp. 520 TaxID=2302931 RepID=UPI0013D53124|nr:hypothetical protein [Dysgonomonas sp. 520]NDW09834.1 hypothetical protein [Dysgonomonas sp. 520]
MDKINFIKEVIEKYGDFEPADVDSKPILYKKLYIRYFSEDEIYLYKTPFCEDMTDNAEDIPTEEIKYENLPNNIINEIYELVIKWNEY